MSQPTRYDCSRADMSYLGTGPCTGCPECAPEMAAELPPELARHYSDDVCPPDCPFCADLARVDAILRRADDEECEWPPVEEIVGGEAGGA